MKKRILSVVSVFSAAFIIAANTSVYAIELPDVGGFFSDLASDIAETASQAGGAIADTASQAGSAIADTASQAGSAIADTATQAGAAIADTASQAGSAIADTATQAGNAITDKASQAGSAIADTATQAGNAVANAAQQAGKTVSDLAGNAGSFVADTAGNIGKTVSELPGNTAVLAQDIFSAASSTASDIGNMTVDGATSLWEQVEKTTGNALDAIDAGKDYVVDAAGNVWDTTVSLSASAADTVGQAMSVLQEKGNLIIQTVMDSVKDIDLSDPQNLELARSKMEQAIDLLYKNGMIDNKLVSKEAMKVISAIVLNTVTNGIQYLNGQITLGEYVAEMSELIIREGLPMGVGYLADKLPIPGAEKIATEAAMYLIALVYGEA